MCFLSVRDRPIPDLRGLLVPTATASIVMAPYLIHGIGSFPGSWFWDGFAYMASRRKSVASSPSGKCCQPRTVLTSSDIKSAQTRYISSSVIVADERHLPAWPAMLRPQWDISYSSASLTFSSSCYFLAKVTMPGRGYLHDCFCRNGLELAGPLLNLVWVNNFDHLLAMSLAPAIHRARFRRCAGVRPLVMPLYSGFSSLHKFMFTQRWR